MMQTNIIKKELKPTIKSNLIWIVSLAALIYASMVKFENLIINPQSFELVMNSLPSSMKAVFGMGNGDISTLSGYYSLIMLYVEIAIGIYIVSKTSAIFSDEETNQTSDFLYTKPFSRENIFFQKIIAVIIQIIILNIMMFILGYLSCLSYNPDIMIFIESGVRLFIISMLFFGIGLYLGTSKYSRHSGLSGNMIVLVMYLIKVVADFLSFESLNYLTIFNYFNYNINYLISLIIVLTITTILFILAKSNFKNKEFTQ